MISGYYGFNNLGDEAILKAWLEGLKDIAQVEITVLSAQPEKTSQLYDIKAINRYNLFAIISSLRQADLFISGGGGLLQDVTGKFSIFYYLGLIVLAQLLGVKTYFGAQGVGPIKSKFKRYLTALVLNRVDEITVRDKKSQQLLSDCGVSKKINLTADLALNLESGSVNRGLDILREEGIILNGPTLGVVIRNWQDNNYLNNLALILNNLADQFELELLIIPFKYPADFKLSNKFKNLLTKQARLVKGNYTPAEMIDIVKTLDFLLGFRLHSLILAIANGVPAAGVAYDPKINNFLAQLGVEPVAEINKLEVEVIGEKLAHLWQNRDSFFRKKEDKLDKLAGLSGLNIELALRLVQNS